VGGASPRRPSDPSTATRGERRRRSDRAVSSVVGVSLLLAVTVVSLGALTAGVGTVVDRGATAATVDRAAADVAGIDPTARTGETRTAVELGGGSLRTAERTVRVVAVEGGVGTAGVDPTDAVAAYPAGALVYEVDGRRVVAAAGGVVVDDGAGFRRDPHLTVATGGAGNGTILFGLPVWNATVASAASGTGEATVRTRVTHRREAFAPDDYALTVETTAPTPWRERFAAAGADVAVRDLDGDGTPSVVARFYGTSRVVVVVHDARVEVGG
jgi:flagellin-like protein